MERCFSIRDRLCILFGSESTLIRIEIDPDRPAKVKILSQRSMSSGCLLDEKERKLLRLALDKSVQPGELRNAASALVKSWRQRGVCVEDFDERTQTLTIESDYGRKIIGFGKFCGERIIDLPHDYLKWIVGTPGIQEKYPDVVEAALVVLKRGMR
jgi:hypothetical protein